MNIVERGRKSTPGEGRAGFEYHQKRVVNSRCSK